MCFLKVVGGVGTGFTIQSKLANEALLFTFAGAGVGTRQASAPSITELPYPLSALPLLVFLTRSRYVGSPVWPLPLACRSGWQYHHAHALPHP